MARRGDVMRNSWGEGYSEKEDNCGSWERISANLNEEKIKTYSLYRRVEALKRLRIRLIVNQVARRFYRLISAFMRNMRKKLRGPSDNWAYQSNLVFSGILLLALILPLYFDKRRILRIIWTWTLEMQVCYNFVINVQFLCSMDRLHNIWKM